MAGGDAAGGDMGSFSKLVEALDMYDTRAPAADHLDDLDGGGGLGGLGDEFDDADGLVGDGGYGRGLDSLDDYGGGGSGEFYDDDDPYNEHGYLATGKSSGKKYRVVESEEEEEFEYCPAPYTYDAPEYVPPEEGEPAWPAKKFVRGWRLDWGGAAAMLLYFFAFIFYLYVRIAKTLDLGGYTWYGVAVLGVEIMGASTTFLYGLNIVARPVHEPARPDDEVPGLVLVDHPYHVRVLVPVYKESLDIVAKTISAALAAKLPRGCGRTVYLCDDGKDAAKRRWCEAAGDDVVYVSGRTRKPGEMNGKSANLNNCLSHIYPSDIPMPPHELVCIFDADQVANADFFLKTLPLFDAGDDVGMVLSPQCFYNLDPHADIFNHGNVQFWEYAQTGYDAFGFISCTGTNFLVRSRAFKEAGWSPEYTLTEDFALGMELKKKRWECRYVDEYLAVGEAPEQLRNCFQQRSRWCKGHFQIMLSPQHCPLFQEDLSIFQRLMYCTGVWSYIVGAVTTPAFIIIPLVTIWGGVFPIVVSWWAALGLSVYMAAQFCVMNYVHRFRDLKALWFANIANAILWWTFVKACWRALGGAFGRSITFKTTLKGADALRAKAVGDLWMPTASFVSLASALGFGLYKAATGPAVVSTLSISIIWIMYNAIPPYLLLHYNFIGKGQTLRLACTVCHLMTTALSLGALVLLWLVYPPQYDYGTVIDASYSFYDAQRLGPQFRNVTTKNATTGAVATTQVGPKFPVPWRGNTSLAWEKGPAALGFGNLTGGFMTGGDAGTVKMTAPAAFATALLAWGLLEFPKGYAKANATAHALDTLRWSNDYLLKTFTKDRKRSQRYNEYLIVYQVGNLTVDKRHWTRPEDMDRKTHRRPAYYVTTYNGTSDLAGQLVAAFASSSMAFRGTDDKYADKLMTAALRLYGAAGRHAGRYTKPFIYKCAPDDPNAQLRAPNKPQCKPADVVFKGSAVGLYNSTSYRDDLTWAAAWMHRATGDKAYLDEAYKYYVQHANEEGQADQRLLVDWDHVAWPATVLLASITDDAAFHKSAQDFLARWLCTSSVVSYTDLGRAYNHFDPRVGTTMNVAMLSAVYGQLIQPNTTLKDWEPQKYHHALKSQRYTCWTRKQMRYVLGDHSPSLIAGVGKRPPTRPADRGASCPADRKVNCTSLNALYTPKPNPHVLKGALVSNPRTWDFFEDSRTSNDTVVGIDQNAGLTGAAAALNQASGTYDQCLQGYGLLSHDKVICDGVILN